ncbi:MAG: phosphopantothenate/pantothenate synthetase [Candidatus Heimdallarchaeota archaeon]|nr:phosphopantothenate/pantothenate synthetase [Candidatus Heimdallarchaeota archaeon]MCG3252607.1 phosphopantothenate/pantothenate synthetase [Candidatus Heimdallarchaeota archaeon]MCK4289745.1 phosphopantothenate/pantothenate synthetase [Candidatus Heimdallarchaeota archaeon]
MSEIPPDHPRYLSLKERHEIIEGMHQKIVAEAGLIAHGRGEAFDYLLGEKTPDYALIQEEAAVATLLLAKHPVISINGNVAIICPDELVALAEKTNAKLEVNLFYRTKERETNIETVLKNAGAKEVLGVNLGKKAETIPEITHKRRIVDPDGIFVADVVYVPLEDGDRTMALKKMGKTVICVDLNPLSRTSVWSDITIVNHVRRATQEMVELIDKLKKHTKEKLISIIKSYDNNYMLQESVKFMSSRLLELSKKQLREG